MVTRKTMLTLALLGLCAGSALAVEMVGVEGSSNQYPAAIDSSIGGKNVKMRLTGTALRKKFVFSVYTLGSYVQEGVRIGSAEELAAADVPKQLHLMMERDVAGKDMAEAFAAAIRANYAAPTFDKELGGLMNYMQANPVKAGDQVWLTHVPGKGLHITVVGKAQMMIENVGFACAVWEIYLGRNNLGDAIKKGITSRL